MSSDWIVFTDLDGTLLDHHDYSYECTNTVRDCLARRNISVHIASSKTFAECIDLYREWRVCLPLTAENGAALAFPDSVSDVGDFSQLETRYRLEANSTDYATIRATLMELRDTHGWAVEGFGDWTAEQVAERTGLGLREAEKARQRIASEPVSWAGTSAGLEHFKTALARRGLRLLRGGRFHHIMGEADKATGVQRILAWYAERAGQAAMPMRVLALGDSENDRAMLEAADAAVVVKRADGTHLPSLATEGVFQTESVAPIGWVEGVNHFICDADSN